MKIGWIRGLFVVAGLYDALLGLAFLIAPKALFDLHEVTPPRHVGYVQFPALLLLVFATMFFRVAADPRGRRELILYGAALKICYSGLVFFHQVSAGVPFMWVPWAWADLAFLVLFVVAWVSLGAAAPASREST